MLPTEEQMVELVKCRSDHLQNCKHQPTYDLSRKGLIRLTCKCGWEFILSSEGDIKN